MNTTRTIITRASAALLMCALSACGPTLKEWQPDQKRRYTYSSAIRQLPPEPVYNRVRWVRAPEPLPVEETRASSVTLVLPVVEFDVKRMPLNKVAKFLGELSGYHTYTASTVATKQVTLRTLGTIDEIAEQISKTAGVSVTIDHANREVRVLPTRKVEPKMFGEKTQSAAVNNEVIEHDDKSTH